MELDSPTGRPPGERCLAARSGGEARRRERRTEAGVGAAGLESDHTDHGNSSNRCRSARDGETARRAARAPLPLRLDPSPQPFRRLDLGDCGTREGKRLLLLGEARAQVRRCGDARVELRPALAREGPVRERCELDGLVNDCVICSTSSHGHSTTTA